MKQRYEYEPDRFGTFADISFCGDWLLLKRDTVWPGEKPQVAVWLKDNELKLIKEGEYGQDNERED